MAETETFPDWQLVTAPGDPADARLEALVPAALEDGQARLRIEQFALSANNVTYVLTARQFGYDRLFPVVQPGQAVPVWGHGRVVESRSALEVGEHYFGLWPAASELVVTPKRTRTGFRDDAAHRAALNPVYNGYQALAGAPGAVEARMAAIRPLFILSHVLAESLRDRFAGMPDVVVTSASSRAATGTAWELKGQARVIGLTSAGHLDFVRRAGVYSDCFGYDDPAALDGMARAGRAIVVLDFAGRAELLGDLERRLGPALREVVRIGWTHADREDAGGGDAARGAVFFAPDEILRRVGRIGAVAFAEALEARLGAFMTETRALYQIDTHEAPGDVMRVWGDLAAGRSDPGRLVSFAG